jgi:hypothetical protein
VPAALPADHDDDDGRAARRDPARARHGDGAELRRPLGISIVGGLILSQLITLYTTPVVYLYLDSFRLWMKERFRGNLPFGCWRLRHGTTDEHR